MKNKIKKILKKIKNSFYKTQKNTEKISSKDIKKEDFSFIVKKKNKQLFEVVSPSFSNFKGIGTKPEQALSDLISNVENNLENLIKKSIMINTKSNEIKNKFTNSLATLKKDNLFKKNNEFIINVYLNEQKKSDIATKIIRQEIASSGQNINRNVPIHMLLDSKGNKVNDILSFGIVVNLN